MKELCMFNTGPKAHGCQDQPAHPAPWVFKAHSLTAARTSAMWALSPTPTALRASTTQAPPLASAAMPFDVHDDGIPSSSNTLPERLELPTLRLTASRSNQLS